MLGGVQWTHAQQRLKITTREILTAYKEEKNQNQDGNFWVAQGCCGNAVFVYFQNLSGQCLEQHDLTLVSKSIGPDDLQKSVPI